MLDQEDLKWIAATSTELNSMLQQISRYTDLARQHKAEPSYLGMLGERVELASRTAQALFDRVTCSILEGSTRNRAPMPVTHPPFTVVPPPGSPLPEEKNSRPQQVAPQPKPQPKPKAQPAPRVVPLPERPAADIRVLNPGGARELILLVDDDLDMSKLASIMLTEAGYRVILAKDGSEALRIYGQIGKSIGLVILDFFLPVFDGDAVFEELRALNPNISVVLSSGFAEQSKVAAMLAQGLRGFIPKPYTQQKLLDQVRSILDAPRAKLA